MSKHGREVYDAGLSPAIALSVVCGVLMCVGCAWWMIGGMR